MKDILLRATTGGIALALLLSTARSQSLIAFDNNTADGLYQTGNNWAGNFGYLPEWTDAFQQYAVIGSSTLPNASATLSTVMTGNASPASPGTPVSPGSLILGEQSGHSGMLTITSTGRLDVPAYNGAPGSVQVGWGGTGVLNINGGKLNSASLWSTNSGSMLHLSGAASVSVGLASLGATTTLSGNAFSFDVANTFTLLGGHDLDIDVIGGSYSTIQVGGAAHLAGSLNVDMTGATGSSWNLLEASSITGFFSDITTNNGTTLGVRVVSNGSGGKIAQMYYDSKLVLQVDRQTGQVAISNPSEDINVAIDAYSIASSASLLRKQNWNSLDDKSVLNDPNIGVDWRESPTPSAPVVSRLSELKPTNSTTVFHSTPFDLGAIYDLTQAAFGAPIANGDLVFTYRKADGTQVTGEVEYVGDALNNNLVLFVDPATGQAVLRNDSQHTIAIDAYTIRSASLSLNSTSWTSLDDSNAAGGDWRESPEPPAGQVTRLSELKPSDPTTLAPLSELSLGNPFVVGGSQDLSLTFRLIQGGALEGDYNGDGTVNLADYTIWRDNLGGLYTVDDYTVWKDNFGATGGGMESAITMNGVVVYQSLALTTTGAINIPEPDSMLSLLSAAACMWCSRWRLKSSGTA